MEGQPFSPQTALVVLIGASEWPQCATLPSSVAFKKSARDVEDYFLDPDFFNLPDDGDHLLNLFDFEGSPLDLGKKVSTWLEKSQRLAVEGGNPIKDLILYYVGHGGFTGGGERAYFLALRSTESDSEGISSLRMTDLATILKKKAHHLRRYLILDCCFAESAHVILQSDPAKEAHTKSLIEFPERGTALLCSSSARDVSFAVQGEKHTMFSGSFLEVLRTGDPTVSTALSFEHVGRKVTRLTLEKYPDIAVRPKVSSPDEREGAIAHIPIFPNAALFKRPVEQRLSNTEIQLERILTKLEALDGVPTRLALLENQTPGVQVSNSSVTEGATKSALEEASDDLEVKRQILKSAPPYLQAQVSLYRDAAIGGFIWISVCLALAGYCTWFGIKLMDPLIVHRPQQLVRNPLCLLIIAIAIYSIYCLWRFGRSPSLLSSPSVENPGPWDSLPVVIAARRSKLYTLFGTIKIASPWFDVGAVILLIASLFLLLVGITGVEISASK